MRPHIESLNTIESNYFNGHLSLDGYRTLRAEIEENYRKGLLARAREERQAVADLPETLTTLKAVLMKRLNAKLAATMPMSHKAFDVSIKSGEGSSGTVELYAAMFGNVDRHGDVIVPGAFKNLPEFIKAGWIAINHQNQSLPVAYVQTAVQDSKGLKITAKFHSTPEAQATRTVVAERMAAGKSVKCSFGFKVLDASMEKRGKDTVQLLKALDIFEASIVNLPANPAAEVTAVKS